jgi:transmembrane 9 superfamily protein 2/4
LDHSKGDLHVKILMFPFITLVSAFYLPGVAPSDYAEGDSVSLFVNPLNSPETALPYDYYDARFHFCQPEGGPVMQKENLGSVLMGDRLFSSPFDIKMNRNTNCTKVCNAEIPAEHSSFITGAIAQDYLIHWFNC